MIDHKTLEKHQAFIDANHDFIETMAMEIARGLPPNLSIDPDCIDLEHGVLIDDEEAISLGTATNPAQKPLVGLYKAFPKHRQIYDDLAEQVAKEIAVRTIQSIRYLRINSQYPGDANAALNQDNAIDVKQFSDVSQKIKSAFLSALTNHAFFANQGNPDRTRSVGKTLQAKLSDAFSAVAPLEKELGMSTHFLESIIENATDVVKATLYAEATKQEKEKDLETYQMRVE